MIVRRLILGAATVASLYPFDKVRAAESVIWAFAGTKALGSQPMANLISIKSGLYGTTSGEGSSNKTGKSYGTVFKLVPSGGNWTQKVLYVFKAGTDGATPVAGLVQGKAGRLYGTTVGGGAPNNSKKAVGAGAVFELIPPAPGTTRWSESVIYAFESVPGGLANPSGSLVVGKNGVLFGTAIDGGPSDFGGVFELIPPKKGSTTWTETTLYEFSGGADGGAPAAGLFMDSTGSLYGTTEAGGVNTANNAICSFGGLPSGCGVVFKLTPPAKGQKNWGETVLYSFTGGADGAAPRSTLISDASNNLYGTTQYGGFQNNGDVFMLAPPANGQSGWTQSTLYEFQGATADGQSPFAGLSFGPNGSLYGTTIYGGAQRGGIVFSLAPPQAGQTNWAETIVYTFLGGPDGTSPSDGAFPAGSLLFGANGDIFGTTTQGGGLGPGGIGNYGTVFEITP